ncbi:MAG: PAS domain S-box protein, partial [Candidatus Rokuibacteriota bacterium]
MTRPSAVSPPAPPDVAGVDLLGQIADAVIAVDTEDRITYWSPGAERLYGHAREEALGRPVADVTRPQRVG